VWLCIGLSSIGVLAGTLVGMSSDHVSKVLLGLVFSLIGGSVIALLQKIPANERNLAGAALFALSVGCLGGIYSGILVSEYQVLTPRAHRNWGSTVALDTTKQTGTMVDTHKLYLRDFDQSAIAAVLDGYAGHHYSRDEAIRQIVEISATSTQAAHQ
jgi:hypothetical protein